MNVRDILFGVCCLGACGISACGTAESDTTEQSDAVLTSPLPVALRLTTIKMNGHSVNAAMPVHVTVTLPGASPSTIYIGDYSGRTATNPNTQFNCSTLGQLPGSDGYCTAKLPLNTTVGSTKFTGTYPANTNSQAASVQINGTRTSFTIDSQGRSNLTCGSAWMMINNSIDGDKITICWQTGIVVPVTAPPIPETVFYRAPGELSQVGLSQMNTISTKSDWSMQTGGGVSFSLSADFKGSDNSNSNDLGGQSASGAINVAGATTNGTATTITTGSATGVSVFSTSMFPNPDDSLYLILVGAHATLTDWHDGTPPAMVTDLSTGTLIWLKLGWLKGLAQTPQVVSPEIPAGNQGVITTYITSAVAQQIVAKDPSSLGPTLDAVVAANPKRFVPASPAHMTLTKQFSQNVQQINAKQTDQYFSQSTGASFSFSLIIGFGFNTMDTLTMTYSNMNQSTASITLQTNDPCIEGTVDLYMDTAFGTILPVPHLEDSCNAPVNCSDGTKRVLLANESLTRGQSLRSCNCDVNGCHHLWTLTLQPDGMLVETYTDGSIGTSFYTPGGTIAIMQSDGNFVVYDASGNPLTDSGTWGNPGAYLILQDDGFIDVYKPLGSPEGGVGGALPALWSIAPGG